MTSHSVKFWLLGSTEQFALNETLVSGLGIAQREHFSGISVNRKTTFYLSRLLLAFSLEQAYGHTAGEWTIEERNGLPPLATCMGFKPNFSISHTDNTIGIALSLSADSAAHKLGLDIEVNNPRRKIAIARYICNDQQQTEMRSLSDNDEKRRYLTRLWTQKEAYFKAHEQGILNPQINNLCVTEDSTELGRMYTTSLDNKTEISIYSDFELAIDTQRLTICMDGNLATCATPEMNWQTFGVTLVNQAAGPRLESQPCNNRAW